MQYTLIGGIKYKKKNLKVKTSTDFSPSELNIFIADAIPVVRAEENVIKGAPIAKSESGYTVFSPITGNITSTENGFITITPKNGDETSVSQPLPKYSGTLDADNREAITSYLLDAGHPEADEIEIRRDFKNTKKVIINCLPLTDEKDAAKIIDGAKLLLFSIGVRSAIIAISKKDRHLAKTIEKCSYDRNMFLIAMLPTVHPLEDPRILARALLPTLDYNNCLVLSPSSCIRALEAITDGTPYIGHELSIVFKRSVYNIFCPCGTSAGDIKNYLKSIFTDSVKEIELFVGKTGIGIPLSDDTLIGEDITTITAKKRKKSNDAPASAKCISCGKCAEVCPMKLIPQLIYSGAFVAGINKCISCGCCSHICPAGVPLAEHIHQVKKEGNYED